MLNQKKMLRRSWQTVKCPEFYLHIVVLVLFVYNGCVCAESPLAINDETNQNASTTILTTRNESSTTPAGVFSLYSNTTTDVGENDQLLNDGSSTTVIYVTEMKIEIQPTTISSTIATNVLDNDITTTEEYTTLNVVTNLTTMSIIDADNDTTRTIDMGSSQQPKSDQTVETIDDAENTVATGLAGIDKSTSEMYLPSDDGNTVETTETPTTPVASTTVENTIATGLAGIDKSTSDMYLPSDDGSTVAPTETPTTPFASTTAVLEEDKLENVSTTPALPTTTFVLEVPNNNRDIGQETEPLQNVTAAANVAQRLREWYSAKVADRCAPETMYDESLRTCIYPRQMFGIKFNAIGSDGGNNSFVNITLAMQLLNNMQSVVSNDSTWYGAKFSRLTSNAVYAMFANFNSKRNATELLATVLREVCSKNALPLKYEDSTSAQGFTTTRCYIGDTIVQLEINGTASTSLCDEPSIRSKCAYIRGECFSNPMESVAEPDLYPCLCPPTRVFDGTMCQPAFTYTVTLPKAATDNVAFAVALSQIRSALTAGSSAHVRISPYAATTAGIDEKAAVVTKPENYALRERISDHMTAITSTTAPVLHRQRRQLLPISQNDEQMQILIASTNDVPSAALAHLIASAFGTNTSEVRIETQNPCALSYSSCPAAHECVPPLDTASNRWPFYCHCAAGYITIAQPMYNKTSDIGALSLFGNEQICTADLCKNSTTYCGEYGTCHIVLNQQNSSDGSSITAAFTHMKCECASGSSGPRCNETTTAADPVPFPVDATSSDIEEAIQPNVSQTTALVDGFCQVQRCGGHGNCYTVRHANGSLHDMCVCNTGYTGVNCDENDWLYQSTTVAFLVASIMFVVVIIALATALIIVSILKMQMSSLLDKLTVRRHSSSGGSQTLPTAATRNGGKTRHTLPQYANGDVALTGYGRAHSSATAAAPTHRRFSRPDLALTTSFPSTAAPGVPHEIYNWHNAPQSETVLDGMPQSPTSQNFATHFTTFRRQPSNNHHYQIPLAVTQASGNQHIQMQPLPQIQVVDAPADEPTRASIYVQSRSGINLANLPNENNMEPQSLGAVNNVAEEQDRRYKKQRSISDASRA